MFTVRVGDTPHEFNEITSDDNPKRRVRIVACSCGVGGVRVGKAPTITISGKFLASDVFNCPTSAEVRVIKITSEKKKYVEDGLLRNSIQQISPAPSGKEGGCYWVETMQGLVAVSFGDAIPIRGMDKIKRIKILKGSTYGSRQNLVPGSSHNVITPPMGEDDENGVWVQGVDMPVQVWFGDFQKAWRLLDE